MASDSPTSNRMRLEQRAKGVGYIKAGRWEALQSLQCYVL